MNSRDVARADCVRKLLLVRPDLPELPDSPFPYTPDPPDLDALSEDEFEDWFDRRYQEGLQARAEGVRPPRRAT